MPETNPASRLFHHAKTGFDSHDINEAAISETLESSLMKYFEPIRNNRKDRKAVSALAKSIASDANWIRVKTNRGDVVGDGTLAAFFNRTASALMLETVLDPRPSVQFENRERCYAYWVEACNPINLTDETESVMRGAFSTVYGKFAVLKKIFNVNEQEIILREAMKNGVPREWPPDGESTYGAAPNGAAAFGDSPRGAYFIGREDELLELKKFCFSEKPFAWWCVTGGGGTGKSRLARELCRRVQAERMTWRRVYLSGNFDDRAELPDGDGMTDWNVLVVADAFGFNIRKIGSWINRLIKSDSVNVKIRLLVLERDGFDKGEPAWARILRDEVGGNFLTNLCYKRDLAPLHLPALNRAVVESALDECRLACSGPFSGGKSLSAYWEKIDPRFSRPDILAAAIEAYNDGAAVTGCGDFKSLFNVLYEHAISRFLSSTNAGVRGDPALSPTNAEGRGDPALSSTNAEGRGDPAFAASMSEYANAVVAGMPYNVIDGYIAIRALMEFGRIEDGNAPGAVRRAISRAWAAWPNNAANFLLRVIDDFFIDFHLPEINQALQVLMELPEQAAENVQTALLYCEPLARLSAARGAGARTIVLDSAEAMLRSGYCQNKQIAHRLSRALFDLTSTAEGPAAPVRAVDLLEKLRSYGHSRDIAITLRLMKALFNVFLIQNWMERKETVVRMDAVHNGVYEQDREITLILAQSLCILTAKQDAEGVKNTVSRLEALREQGYKEDRGITLELVKALLVLNSKQDETGRKVSAARIEALRDDGFEADREITLGLVKALLNLSVKQDAAGMAETAEQIEALRNQGYEGDREIAFELATALFNLSARQDEAGVRRTVERLETLRGQGYARDSGVTLRLAQALFCLTAKQGAAGRDEAVIKIEALREAGFRDDRDITLTLVKSLYNLTIDQDSDEAMETVAKIEDIYHQGYAQDKDIKLLFAKALFNLTTKLDETGITDAVTRLETLRDL